MVPNISPALSAAGDAERRAARWPVSGLLRSGIGQQAGSAHNGHRAAHHPPPAGSAQLVEQQPAPEQAHQAVDVPQREGDREPHIADGEDRQGIGHRPQHSREHRPDDEVRLLAQVHQHIAGSFQAPPARSIAPRTRRPPCRARSGTGKSRRSPVWWGPRRLPARWPPPARRPRPARAGSATRLSTWRPGVISPAPARRCQ